MDVLNLSAAALFESLAQNKIEKKRLLDGTQLSLEFMQDLKKKHSWADFIKMYENASVLLGPEKAAREIAYHGIYNEGLSTLRKIGTGLVDVKAAYWFLGTFACRHLFKDTVKFKYTKISSNHVQMEIVIAPELENCPLLLETYVYLFENLPTVLGLPKASVVAEIADRKGVYTIRFIRSSYFKYLFTKITKAMTGYDSAVVLMEELETQSLQLSKLLEEKSELLRILSHDISNISAIVDLSLARVLKSELLEEADRALIIKAMTGSNRLRCILKDVQKLEICNIRGVSLEAVDLDQVFITMEEFFREQLVLKGIELVTKNHLPPGSRAFAERSSLEVNVLSNLLSNAIKFSNSGSKINMEAYLENNEVVISVADSGIGMSDEDMKNLFNTKLRKSTVGTSGEVGSGLGLGIVKRYVQLYNGKVTAATNYPAGTIFRITLPIYQEAAATTS